MSDEKTTNQSFDPTQDLQEQNTNSGAPMGSEPVATPSEPLEASVDNSITLPPKVVNDTTPSDTKNKGEMVESGQNTENTLENQALGIEPNTEPISESVQILEPGTAQIPPNEPFENTQDKPLVSEPEPIKPKPVSVILPNKNKALELLAKAKLTIQSRKRKKLDKIMTLFLKKSKITNDEVEKFLHVSDATAERYLNILEEENKIKQVGKTGHAVSYTKI